LPALCRWGFFVCLFVFLNFGDTGVGSGLCACKAGSLQFEPCLYPFLLWLFCR
jgi:hypothetical protein